MPVIATSSTFDPSYCFSTGVDQSFDSLPQFPPATPHAAPVRELDSLSNLDRSLMALTDLGTTSPRAQSTPSRGLSSSSGTLPNSEVTPIAAKLSPAMAHSSGSGLALAQTQTPPVANPGSKPATIASRVPDRSTRVAAVPRAASQRLGATGASTPTSMNSSNPPATSTRDSRSRRSAANMPGMVELTTCSMDDAKLRPPYLRRQRPLNVPFHSPGRNDCSRAVASTSGR
jgi:hypothetical protein